MSREVHPLEVSPAIRRLEREIRELISENADVPVSIVVLLAEDEELAAHIADQKTPLTQVITTNRHPGIAHAQAVLSVQTLKRAAEDLNEGGAQCGSS